MGFSLIDRVAVKKIVRSIVAEESVPDGSITTAKLGGDITTAGKALLDDANAAAQRTTLGAAASSHTHVVADLTDDGALAALSTVGTAQIDADAVTYAKIQNTAAADILLGRGNGAGAGDVQEISLGTNLSLSGTTLNAASSGLADGDKGDITVSASGTAWAVDPGAITLAKMADLAQDTAIGRVTASTGVPETFTVTAAGRAILDDIDAAAQRTTLGAAATSHAHAAADTTSGSFDMARIPTGTTSSTACIGNDARLSDARTPLSHSHTAGDLPSLNNLTVPSGSVSFNDQQATSFRIENRTSDPGVPTVGQIWLRTDL